MVRGFEQDESVVKVFELDESVLKFLGRTNLETCAKKCEPRDNILQPGVESV